MPFGWIVAALHWFVHNLTCDLDACLWKPKNTNTRTARKMYGRFIFASVAFFVWIVAFVPNELENSTTNIECANRQQNSSFNAV